MRETLDDQSRNSLVRYRIGRADETMLGLKFISNGLLEKEHGKTFSRLFEIRHSGDYDDFVYCDQQMIDEYTPKAMDFINRIKELLKSLL